MSVLTVPCDPMGRRRPGHFRASPDVAISIEGSSQEAAPRGWSLGGWDESGRGAAGPCKRMTPGPYAFVFPAGWRSLDATTIHLEAKDGDLLETPFGLFRIAVDSSSFVRLEVVA